MYGGRPGLGLLWYVTLLSLAALELQGFLRPGVSKSSREKTLEHWMKKNGIARTWPDVLSEIETLRWSYIEVGKKRTGRPDRLKPEQLPILEALGIAGEFGRMEVSDRP